MELKLDSLIDKVKLQGIDEGERKAKEIKDSAQREAQEIVASAEDEARKIIEEAQQKSETLLSRGKDGLKQAERDLLLQLEGKLRDFMNKYLAATTAEALGSSRLIDIITTAISHWNFDVSKQIFVHLSPEDANNITKEAISGAVKSSSGEVEIKVDASVRSGFRLSTTGGAYAFDFTQSSITESLTAFLSPNVKELLK